MGVPVLKKCPVDKNRMSSKMRGRIKTRKKGQRESGPEKQPQGRLKTAGEEKNPRS